MKRLLIILFVLILVGCSSSQKIHDVQEPESTVFKANTTIELANLDEGDVEIEITELSTVSKQLGKFEETKTGLWSWWPKEVNVVHLDNLKYDVFSCKQGNYQIEHSIVNLFEKNYKIYKNAMPSDNYFLVLGATANEFERKPNYIKFGSLVDVIADTIQKCKFAGWYCTAGVNTITNPNHAQFRLLKNNSDIENIRGKVQIENGILKIHEKIDRLEYLDDLRTKEGFKQVASILGTKYVNRIANSIYEQ